MCTPRLRHARIHRVREIDKYMRVRVSACVNTRTCTHTLTWKSCPLTLGREPKVLCLHCLRQMRTLCLHTTVFNIFLGQRLLCESDETGSRSLLEHCSQHTNTSYLVLHFQGFPSSLKPTRQHPTKKLTVKNMSEPSSRSPEL